MYDQPKESDWKAFKKLVPVLRERYLDERRSSFVSILNDENLTATEQFWNLEERIEKEANILRACLDGHSRSSMARYMFLMYRHQMLNDGDLETFSEELADRVRMQ